MFVCLVYLYSHYLSTNSGLFPTISSINGIMQKLSPYSVPGSLSRVILRNNVVLALGTQDDIKRWRTLQYYLFYGSASVLANIQRQMADKSFLFIRTGVIESVKSSIWSHDYYGQTGIEI